LAISERAFAALVVIKGYCTGAGGVSYDIKDSPTRDIHTQKQDLDSGSKFILEPGLLCPTAAARGEARFGAEIFASKF
jgi:hypothetical protein